MPDTNNQPNQVAAQPALTTPHDQPAGAPVDKAADQAKQPKPAKKTPARLLADCLHGRANDLVALDAAELKSAEAQGLADSDKAAIAYAQSLPQNQHQG